MVNAANQAGAGGLAASIQGQAATARDLNQFAATVGSRISQADLRSGDAGKEDLEALLEGVDNPQIRKAVQAKVDALAPLPQLILVNLPRDSTRGWSIKQRV